MENVYHGTPISGLLGISVDKIIFALPPYKLIQVLFCILYVYMDKHT